MLKFSVQTFYPPLFSHSFPFRNFPSATLFPSVILFPFKSFPHQKAQSKSQTPKTQSKAQSKSQRQKVKETLKPSFRDLLYTAANRLEHRLSGSGVTLQQEKFSFLLV
jgi:hypothetical protein